MKGCRPLRIALALTTSLWVAGAVAGELPESPWALAGPQRLRGFADVQPLCVPDPQRPEIAPAARIALIGTPQEALRALPAPGTTADPATEASVALVRAIFEARTLQPNKYEQGRVELARRLQRHGDPAARVCGRLERARLALRANFAAQALGDLAVAQHELPEREESLARTIEFYRAEAEWMSGRASEALDRYGGLASEAGGKIAWVAQMRILAADPDVTWTALSTRLEQGRELGIRVDGWSVQAGELAFRAGDLGGALHWFSRAEQLPPRDELAAIRKADALIVQGHRHLAVRILERIEQSARRQASREIASMRLARDGVGSESRSEARLLRAARSTTPRIAARALEQLLQRYLAAGQPEQALEAVGRLRNLAPRGGVRGMDSATDAVIQLAADTSTDCVTLIRRLAGGREAWLRSIRSSAPALRLGDCAMELGLTSTAIDVYRALSRRFPDQLGPELTLRIAEASFALGERLVVDSMSASHDLTTRGTDVPFEQRAAWLRLRGQIAIEDGRFDAALDLFRRLAAAPETPPRERERAARALTVLPAKDASWGTLADALESVLRWERDLPEPLQGAAWLRLADLRHAQGRASAAQRAYRQAVERLPPGRARGRSLHALVSFSSTRNEREHLLSQLVSGEQAGPWTELAKGELRLSHLQHLIDRSERGAR